MIDFQRLKKIFSFAQQVVCGETNNDGQIYFHNLNKSLYQKTCFIPVDAKEC